MKNSVASSGELQTHMLSTYHSVRLGVGLMGIALVLGLWAIGPLTDGAALRASMSAYYHSPMRNLFVGFLVAIGALLYLYKGFSDAENWTLNAAGMLAVGVAWFPTVKDGATRDAIGYAHLVFAFSFFLCIAYVSVFRAADTLSLIPNADVARKYRATYRLLGWGMFASPVLALIASALLDPGGNNRSIIFYIEAAGVLMFAAYWLVKSREMRLSRADLVAGAAMLKKSEDPEHKRTVPGNLVVAEHDTAYQEMLDALAAKGPVKGPPPGEGYMGGDSRLPTKR